MDCGRASSPVRRRWSKSTCDACQILLPVWPCEFVRSTSVRSLPVGHQLTSPSCRTLSHDEAAAAGGIG
eukprot:5813102-Prymnesium_polylepis.1